MDDFKIDHNPKLLDCQPLREDADLTRDAQLFSNDKIADIFTFLYFREKFKSEDKKGPDVVSKGRFNIP